MFFEFFQHARADGRAGWALIPPTDSFECSVFQPTRFYKKQENIIPSLIVVPLCLLHLSFGHLFLAIDWSEFERIERKAKASIQQDDFFLNFRPFLNLREVQRDDTTNFQAILLGAKTSFHLHETKKRKPKQVSGTTDLRLPGPKHHGCGQLHQLVVLFCCVRTKLPEESNTSSQRKG